MGLKDSLKRLEAQATPGGGYCPHLRPIVRYPGDVPPAGVIREAQDDDDHDCGLPRMVINVVYVSKGSGPGNRPEGVG